GQYHPGLPLSYGVSAPALWFTIPEQERARRTRLSSDTFIIDERHFFIVGNIDIPIIGSDQCFQWTVWVSLSEENFDRSGDLWEQPGRETEPPYFGWLSTELALYPSTLNLKTHVYTRPVGVRPFIEVEPTDHPLALEQRNGITWERVEEIAEAILHG
nr:DUF2199 domain-containing protein [Ardenticatenales bacterium]